MQILRHVRRGSSGQGLVETTGVLALFGLIVAVAVPSYLGFTSRRGDERARANLLAAAAAADAYREDTGSYRGLDSLDLLRINPRLSPTLVVTSSSRLRFCLTDTVDGRTWSLRGPVRGTPRFRPSADCS